MTEHRVFDLLMRYLDTRIQAERVVNDLLHRGESIKSVHLFYCRFVAGMPYEVIENACDYQITRSGIEKSIYRLCKRNRLHLQTFSRLRSMKKALNRAGVYGL